MRSKVNFGHPKWPTAAILSKFKKKIKLRIDLNCPEMRSKVNFGHAKMADGSHFVHKFQTKNVIPY